MRAPCVLASHSPITPSQRVVITSEILTRQRARNHELHELGIRDVVIPRRGRPSKARQDAERGRAFRRTVKWRTGCEGRISHLKRNYGWDRAMIDTTEGARIWTGHGVLAHNLAKIAALTA